MKKLSIFTTLLLVVTTFQIRPASAEDIVVFGATGKFASKMVREALDRGHTVYGVSRTPAKFTYTDKNFVPVKGNPTDLESVKEITKGKDGVLIALGDRTETDPQKTVMNVTAQNISEALADLGPDGPVVVAFGGGNTSADTKEEMLAMLAERTARPAGAGGGAMGGVAMGGAPMGGGAMGGREAAGGAPGNNRLEMIMLSQWATYQTYRASNINWVFLAPPRNILGVTGGEDKRTGNYQITAEKTLKDSANEISNSDIAVAAVDLVESREYSQTRVAISY